MRQPIAWAGNYGKAGSPGELQITAGNVGMGGLHPLTAGGDMLAQAQTVWESRAFA